MSRTPFVSLLLLLGLSGCSQQPPAKSTGNEAATMNQATVVKTIAVSGFDPDGEPEIREMSDGTLAVLFNFMPPSYAEDEEAKYADFEKQIEQAVGVPVYREDRERFLLRNPQSDTAEKLKAFLESYRQDD